MFLRRNPLGLPVELPTEEGRQAARPPQLVRVGRRGVHTHIYDPEHKVVSLGTVIAVGAPICESGYRSPTGKKNRGVPELYACGVRTMGGAAAHAAQFVTCLRCAKLAKLNLARYNSFIRPTS